MIPEELQSQLAGYGITSFDETALREALEAIRTDIYTDQTGTLACAALAMPLSPARR